MSYNYNGIESPLIVHPDTQKLFIFDLDGTIIFDGQRLTSAIEKSLKNIISSGHLIYFATGRSYRDYLPMLPSWCHELPAVTFGGGLVTNQEQLIYQQTMDSDELREFVSVLEQNHISFLIDSHHSYFHSSKESWILHDILAISGQQPNKYLDVVLNEGAYKLLVLDNHAQKLAHEFVNKFNWGLKYHSYHDCFDVMPAHVNKFVGVSKLPLVAKENVFIFGNDYNDLELMQNFENNVMLGEYSELLPYAKIKIAYDSNLISNLNQVISNILKK